jgi:hypothetical protein
LRNFSAFFTLIRQMAEKLKNQYIPPTGGFDARSCKMTPEVQHITVPQAFDWAHAKVSVTVWRFPCFLTQYEPLGFKSMPFLHAPNFQLFYNLLPNTQNPNGLYTSL